MANGDDAAAAGYPILAGTDDRRNGWDEINLSRDLTAREKTANTAALNGKAPSTHTHTSGQISDATSSPTANTVAKRNSAGQISVADPTSGAHAATKDYVDGAGGAANGPTSGAYNRTATGSGQYAVWMNSSLQFMRNTSSRRFKKRIKTLPPNLALDLVLRLRPVTYEAKDETIVGTHIGLIAEEVDEVFPEVVTRDKPGARAEGVNYEFLVAPLIAAIQALESRVAILEGREPGDS